MRGQVSCAHGHRAVRADYPPDRASIRTIQLRSSVCWRISPATTSRAGDADFARPMESQYMAMSSGACTHPERVNSATHAARRTGEGLSLVCVAGDEDCRRAKRMHYCTHLPQHPPKDSLGPPGNRRVSLREGTRQDHALRDDQLVPLCGICGVVLLADLRRKAGPAARNKMHTLRPRRLLERGCQPVEQSRP